MLVSAHPSRLPGVRPGRLGRAGLRALKLALSLSLLSILIASCNDGRDADVTGTSVRGSGTYPALDVRGGDFDSQISSPRTGEPGAREERSTSLLPAGTSG